MIYILAAIPSAKETGLAFCQVGLFAFSGLCSISLRQDGPSSRYSGRRSLCTLPRN